jgi:NAD(P)-dependent dehydrogenase (short-subunit alcohol dehydrogenase family)
MKNRVAIVTGANRGIGLEVCRQLAKLGNTVVLTSRDKDKGLKAVADLQKKELPVRYHELDVTSATSVRELASFMEKGFGRCDILVNNAGIFPDNYETGGILNTKAEIIREAFETNTLGPVLMIQALVPLMKKNKYGRIVNFSSGMGQLSEMNGGSPGYRISKTAVNAVTRIVHDELKGENILVNSMCPGWVKTEMGGKGATKSVEEGADTAVWLATLPDGGPSGKFFRERKEMSW